MKTTFALFAAFAAALASAHAQITINSPSYGVTSYYTHPDADTIVSFDFGANGKLYYQTATSFYRFGGLFEAGGGVTTNVVPGSDSLFSGASVVSIGPSIYFNNNAANTYLYKYGPVTGAAAVSLPFTTPNYGLAANGGRLFLTGAVNYGTNHIYYLNPGAGSAVSDDPAVDLGVDSGSSGPLAFDKQGNLFYSPGSGDQHIYRWSKADVDNAIADPAANSLGIAGRQWASYSTDYVGGTSMALDANGNLLLTLTNFSDPSVLDKFSIGPDGQWNGQTETILSAPGLLGELRLVNGALLLSDGNQIFQLVPEPSAIALLAVAALLAAFTAPKTREA